MSTEKSNEASSVLKEGVLINHEQQTVLRRDNEEYTIIKKLPKRFPTRQNDIYITNRTNFKAQFEKCQSLLQKDRDGNDKNEIVLHAMGPAINRYNQYSASFVLTSLP